MALKSLGWSSPEISKITGVNDSRVRQIVNNINSYKINEKFEEGKTIEELATLEIKRYPARYRKTRAKIILEIKEKNKAVE